jgi:sec-independent protein translocase protein TatA
MPFISGGHIWLILILVLVLVMFGPKRLPELGSGLGRALRDFRQAMSEKSEQPAPPEEQLPLETVPPSGEAA